MRGESVVQKTVNQDFIRRAVKPVAEHLSIEDSLRFVAGSTMDDALAHTEELNKEGITALLDILGEHVEEIDGIIDAQREYVLLQDKIDNNQLEANLSVKPTHLGLDVESAEIDSYDLCLENLKHLAGKAEEQDSVLWIDMESSNYTDQTIDLYTDLLEDFNNVGLCIQSYLRQSEDDLEKLMEEDDALIRLVKGAYDEPEDVAYQDWGRVGENYEYLLEKLFETDTSVAVATHDRELVEYARKLEKEHEKPEDEIRFQFLTGVKEELKRDLADEGYDVDDYVPYGEDWFDYFWRRVQEKPDNIRHILP